jgi:galactokinase
MVKAWAPGRVNLIGDHTDYMGGLVLPMAIDLGTSVAGERGGDAIVLRSHEETALAVVPVDVHDPRTIEPAWARYVAGVVAELKPEVGFTGEVRSTLPLGRGLSSSAALEVAVALALGASGSALEVARLCQRAEHLAAGVPCGIMDQLASLAGVDGCATLIDCRSFEVDVVAIPEDAEIVVVDSLQQRALADSAYSERRAQCEAAERQIGPLRDASAADVSTIADPVARHRARHVVSENTRVLDFAAALEADDLSTAGALMNASHASLRDDFEVSTPTLDALVERLVAMHGVHGARLTGAGFGGCVVALADPGVISEGWRVTARGGALLLDD